MRPMIMRRHDIPRLETLLVHKLEPSFLLDVVRWIFPENHRRPILALDVFQGFQVDADAISHLLERAAPSVGHLRLHGIEKGAHNRLVYRRS